MNLEPTLRAVAKAGRAGACGRTDAGKVTHLGDDYIFVPDSDWHVVVRDVVSVPDPE